MAASSNLSGLLQRTNLDDDEEVLAACNATLKKSKSDTEALHAKIVALLKLDRFEEALQVIETGGDALKAQARLEWAYTLYKNGKLKEAAGVAAGVAARESAQRGTRHVEAQASYRAEDFLRTAEIYMELAVEEGFAHEENDLRINSSANDAQSEWKGLGNFVQKKKPGREDLEAFETAYNAACGSISRGELSQGEVLLRRAKDLCQASDELTGDEKTAELLPIMVQQLFVLTSLGKAEEAKKLAGEISIVDIPDNSTKRIAQNNVLAAAGTKNPFLLHRQFHNVPETSSNDSLFEFQSLAAQNSAFSLELQSLKFAGVARSTSNAISQHPSPTISPSINTLAVINAAAKAENATSKIGLKQILPVLEKRPNDVGLLLVVIQLYTLTNNHGTAISLLESFLKRLDESIDESYEDVRYSPGLVAVLVALYKLQGRKMHVRSELAKAASYWRRKSKPSINLLRAAGTALLDSSDPDGLKVAAEIFSTLRELQPDDRFAIAGFVASHASTTLPSQLQSLTSKLTSINRLTSSVDASALEEAGIPQLTSVSVIGKRPAETQVSKSAKKARKSRLPKDYDPDKAPDPERWLPLQERSTYRPRGKKGKQKAAQMTQGGFSSGADKGEDGGEGAKAAAKPVAGASASKKKKGKGKK